MRSAHNIKGGARSIGISEVGRISHCAETLFLALKDGTAPVTSDVTDLCLEAVDRIKQAMESFEEENDLNFDIEDLITRLETASDGDAPIAPPAKSAEQEEPPTEASTEASTEPEPKLEPKPEPEPEPKVSAPEEKTAVQQAPEKSAPEKKSAATKGGESIRVAIEKLDQIEAIVEELQSAKIEIDDFVDELKKLHAMAQDIDIAAFAPTGIPGSGLELGSLPFEDVREGTEKIYKNMRARARNLGVVLSSLMYETRNLRLVPAAGLTRPLVRSVRDIARQMNKKVSFNASGEDTEMDRVVLEMLNDPLVHIIRNAIDHGVEEPTIRKAAGKPEVGEINVEFQLVGSRIQITVKDDGAGVNIERVRQKAIEKKIISEAEANDLQKAEILDLIFHPGFSTKDIITDVSGRGVGMDVVRTNLNALKGSVFVDSEDGVGSTFTLQVPLTLATENGLIIRSGGQIFAIPVGAVDRVVDLTTEEMVDVEASQALLLDGNPVPVRYLSGLLGIEQISAQAPNQLPAVIIASGWRRAALVVDEIIARREMVVRPLREPLNSVRNVSGGTILSGGVVIVLNPGDLMTAVSQVSASLRVDIDSADGEAGESRPSVLVVDDSLTTRTLVKNILEASGYDVSVRVNGLEGWEALAESDFDLVVSDVQMPIMDGFELTDKIKTSESYGEIPVIIVTSLANDEDKQRGLDVGADAYIVKGEFETRILLDVVNQLI
ncbi:MAG: hybrid sensor histidine kinase/response regulator [Rhodospirillaceae bacterium]|nr:hybrid sensor histidine kinase/response regulator [Rhodospirillaceae bacterium]